MDGLALTIQLGQLPELWILGQRQPSFGFSVSAGVSL